MGNGRDYHEMAKKASKAIKEFPNGPRTPNSQFAGFFFSKSMPASELLKLKEMKEAEAKARKQAIPEEVGIFFGVLCLFFYFFFWGLLGVLFVFVLLLCYWIPAFLRHLCPLK